MVVCPPVRSSLFSTMITRVTGSLLDATEDWIAHQCNCCSRYASGLALAIFKRHPAADDYARRHDHEAHTRKCPGLDDMGTIMTHPVTGAPHCGVINMMAQFYPGPSKPHYRGKDLASDRKVAFQACLEAIAALPGITSVAFPYHIGCGLAKGTWRHYRRMIGEWVTAHPTIRVAIYIQEAELAAKRKRHQKRKREQCEGIAAQEPFATPAKRPKTHGPDIITLDD